MSRVSATKHAPPGTLASLFIVALVVGVTSFFGVLALDPFAPTLSDAAAVTGRSEQDIACPKSGRSTTDLRCTRYSVGGVTDTDERWRVVSRQAHDLVTAGEEVTIGRSRITGRLTGIDTADGNYRAWRSWSQLLAGAAFLGGLGVSVVVAHQSVRNIQADHSLRTGRALTAATIVTTAVATVVVVVMVYSEPVASRSDPNSSAAAATTEPPTSTSTTIPSETTTPLESTSTALPITDLPSTTESPGLGANGELAAEWEAAAFSVETTVEVVSHEDGSPSPSTKPLMERRSPSPG